MKKITFKFKDTEGLTEPRKLKHTCTFEVDEYLRWDKIVSEFQVFLEKLRFDYLSKDNIDLVNMIYQKFDDQDDTILNGDSVSDCQKECQNCQCNKK
jgi:hypothetical protein